MKRWWKELDRLLRGEATQGSVLSADDFRIPVGGLLLMALALAALYGVCMGFFAGFRDGGPVFLQWLAGTIKVPALFFLTLVVTFPSLYVFNALAGSRLSFAAVFQLLVAALAVNVAVLASLGPIVAFFSVSTTSYPFILLLNVLVFITAGVFGFTFMLRILRGLWGARGQMAATSQTRELEKPESHGGNELTLDAMAKEATAVSLASGGPIIDRRVKNVFVCWMVVAGLVCAQMSWVLRPILGKPTEAFHWFSPRESNFFEAVWDAFRTLLS